MQKAPVASDRSLLRKKATLPPAKATLETPAIPSHC
jgi:hypothetical protein